MSKQHVVLCAMAHIAVLVVVFLSGGVNAIYDECYFDADDSYQACEPTIEDVINTGNFTFTVYPANITCGTPPSQYRRLGDRFDSYLTCNATSQDPAANHQPNYMVDGDTNSWWQSVTMATTRRLQVNVTLSFGKLYQLEGDIIITFNSGRPEKMILEKSADRGVIWSPLQYYARSCTEFYALGAGYEVTVDNLAKIICDNTSVESSTRPRPGGKVVFPVMSERLQPLLPNQTNFEDYYRRRDTETGLAEFLIFTDLRLRLLEPASDGRQNYDMYYYAISDLEVIARCYCHLHASSCGTDSNNQSVCQCAHNTAGRDCEKCQPLYNERPWQKGRYSPFDTGSANECKKCECNDHAMSCVYDPQYGRGVCENCQHNTTSRHCELCLPGFYPNDTLPLSDTRRCIECGCEPLGSTDGNCSQAANLTVSLGQCTCKPLVTGRRCDQCYPGFWGLMGPDLAGVCKPCNCDPDGIETGRSECAQTDGQCSCKPTISNRTCNTCADGYYDFPTNVSGRGCLPCKCDAGGAVNSVCEKTEGVCTCKTFIGGTKCDQVQPDYFLPALDDVIYQPQTGCNLTSDLWTTDNPFDGAVFASCDMMTDVQLGFEPIVGTMKQLHISWPYYIGVRYTMFEPAAVQSGTITLSVSENSGANITGYGFDNSSCPIQQGVAHSADVTLISGHSRAWLSENASVFLDVRCRYDVTLSLSANGNNSAAIRLDSFILLPYLSAQIGEVQRMFQVLRTNDNKTEVETTYRACVEQLAALTSRDLALHSNHCAILMSMSAELYGGAKACGCDPRGSEPGSICAALGGQCLCKTGVAGRKCDTCKPGYFNYTENGCTRCATLPCPVVVPTTVFPRNTTATTTTANTTTPLVTFDATPVETDSGNTTTFTTTSINHNSSTAMNSTNFTIVPPPPEPATANGKLSIYVIVAVASFTVLCLLLMCGWVGFVRCRRRKLAREGWSSHPATKLSYVKHTGRLYGFTYVPETSNASIVKPYPSSAELTSLQQATQLDPNSLLQMRSMANNEKLPSFSAIDRKRKPRLVKSKAVDCTDDYQLKVFDPLPVWTSRAATPQTLAVIAPMTSQNHNSTSEKMDSVNETIKDFLPRKRHFSQDDSDLAYRNENKSSDETSGAMVDHDVTSEPINVTSKTGDEPQCPSSLSVLPMLQSDHGNDVTSDPVVLAANGALLSVPKVKVKPDKPKRTRRKLRNKKMEKSCTEPLDAYNSFLETSDCRQNILSSEHDYAGYDSFDEVRGSLV